MNSTTEEGLVLPNEWSDYFYHPLQFMDGLDFPFAGGATSEAAVSYDTSFGDDVLFSGSDHDIFSTPGSGGDSGDGGGGCGSAGGYDTATSLKVSGCDETMYLIHDLTGTASYTSSGPAATVISPENSTAASNIETNMDLSPRPAIAKQVKRRSRASRRTPTTLLNASIKNFRTLVQQYTGNQSSSSGFNRNGKGPINLNFSAPNDRNNFPVTFGNICYSPEQLHQQQVDHQTGQQGLMINSFVDS